MKPAVIPSPEPTHEKSSMAALSTNLDSAAPSFIYRIYIIILLWDPAKAAVNYTEASQWQRNAQNHHREPIVAQREVGICQIARSISRMSHSLAIASSRPLAESGVLEPGTRSN